MAMSRAASISYYREWVRVFSEQEGAYTDAEIQEAEWEAQAEMQRAEIRAEQAYEEYLERGIDDGFDRWEAERLAF